MSETSKKTPMDLRILWTACPASTAITDTNLILLVLPSVSTYLNHCLRLYHPYKILITPPLLICEKYLRWDAPPPPMDFYRLMASASYEYFRMWFFLMRFQNSWPPPNWFRDPICYKLSIDAVNIISFPHTQTLPSPQIFRHYQTWTLLHCGIYINPPPHPPSILLFP